MLRIITPKNYVCDSHRTIRFSRQNGTAVYNACPDLTDAQVKVNSLCPSRVS